MRRRPHERNKPDERTFVCTTSYQDLRLWIQRPAKIGLVMCLDSLAEAETAFRMGVMVCGDGVQCLLGGRFNPLRRSKVHVSLSKVNAVRWEIGGT